MAAHVLCTQRLKLTYDEQEVHTAILPRGVAHFDEIPGAKPASKVFCVNVDLLTRSSHPSLHSKLIKIRNQEIPTSNVGFLYGFINVLQVVQ